VPRRTVRLVRGARPASRLSRATGKPVIGVARMNRHPRHAANSVFPEPESRPSLPRPRALRRPRTSKPEVARAIRRVVVAAARREHQRRGAVEAAAPDDPERGRREVGAVDARVDVRRSKPVQSRLPEVSRQVELPPSASSHRRHSHRRDVPDAGADTCVAAVVATVDRERAGRPGRRSAPGFVQSVFVKFGFESGVVVRRRRQGA